MKKLFAKILSASVIALSSNAAVALTPAPGFWAVDGELNGQPGRGFQIDTSGSVLIFSYYGYRTDGQPTFYLSSGAFDGRIFRGPLKEYGGGTPIGGQFRNGYELNDLGDVEIVFDTQTKGWMRLPGEERRPISRFTFVDNSSKFNVSFDGVAGGLGGWTTQPTKYAFILKPVDTGGTGAFSLTRSAFFSGTCEFTGEYRLAGVGIEATGDYTCVSDSFGSTPARITRGFFTTGVLTIMNGIYNGSLIRDDDVKEIHTAIMPPF